MEYKTLRFPGHAAIMKAIRELGLLDTRAVSVKGTKVVPRDAFIATVAPGLTKSAGRALVAPRIEVAGQYGKRAALKLLHRYHERTGITAEMRQTSYQLAINGAMQEGGEHS